MKNFFTPNSCTSLVVWNTISLGSTLGLPKLTNFLRGMTGIPSYYLSVITGILLGDASIRKSAPHHNARLAFTPGGAPGASPPGAVAYCTFCLFLACFHYFISLLCILTLPR